MKYRYITAIILLLAAVLQVQGQALTDRYNKNHPVTIVCSRSDKPYEFKGGFGAAEGTHVDIARAVLRQIGVPCTFVLRTEDDLKSTFENGEADLIFADISDYDKGKYYFSEEVVNYRRIRPDSIVEVHLVGRDRQLVEQFDDQFMRLKLRGDIHSIYNIWMHPERHESQPSQAPLWIGIITLVLAAILGVACYVVKIRTIRGNYHANRLDIAISKTGQIGQYYQPDDDRLKQEMICRYKTLFNNPFVAIAFYDKNGNLTEQNEVLQNIGTGKVSNHIQPLYNAEGEVANYFVTQCIKDIETT